MLTWIDIENASGERYGDGPIVTATGWESVRRLDAAGTFSFEMPASDPRTSVLANKRIARCWQADADGVREVGAGTIEQIEIVASSGEGPTMLRVSGDDLLRELANRSVGDLALWQETLYTPTVSRVDTYTNQNLNTTTPLTLPATVNLSPSEPLSYLYVAHPSPFSTIRIQLSTLNFTVTNTFQIQVYNASNPAMPDWEDVGGLDNGSAVVTSEPPFIRPFGVAGSTDIAFDPPSGWTPIDGLYIVRMFDAGADLSSFRIEACQVVVVEPVTDGLQRIMALAPPGWSLDPAGVYATAEAVYMQFAGESVLQALVQLAQQTGEHFVLSPAGRRVWWIGTAQDDSGLRAVQHGALDSERMLITKLGRTASSYDLFTRLYAYGGGVGAGRLTMARANVGAAGYTLAADGSYLEADAAVTTYGRIDRRVDFQDVTPVDVSERQLINAANALYKRVYHLLRRHSALQYAYDVEVAPGPYRVWPGQTVRVSYHEWVEGYHSVNIETDLWVLEVRQRVDAEGLHVAALQVATVDYAPPSDGSVLAKLWGMVQRGSEMVASGYSSTGAGVPVAMTVNNGQVTSVRRVRAVPDGWYTLSSIDRVKIEGGVVAYMEPV